MSTNAFLEERLAIVEAAIVELQKQIQSMQRTNWLEQITGSFENEPAFDEVLGYGRAIRKGYELSIDTNIHACTN